MSKCLNVIVFYNNYQEVFNYTMSVCSIAKDIVDVAIVVNSDKYKEIDKLQKGINEFENVEIIRYNDNVGYLNAFLSVIQSVEIKKYDYFILSNTDIEYPENDFYQKLVSMDFEEDIGCIAPSIYTPHSHSYSNPHYKDRISRSHYEKLYKLFTYPSFARIYLKLSSLKNRSKGKQKQPSCIVYCPHGAFMIFSRNFVEKIKGYKYGARMYSEEACIGEMLRKLHMKCYYWNKIEVNHLCSTVTGKINYKNRFVMWRDSIAYILNEYY